MTVGRSIPYVVALLRCQCQMSVLPPLCRSVVDRWAMADTDSSEERARAEFEAKQRTTTTARRQQRRRGQQRGREVPAIIILQRTTSEAMGGKSLMMLHHELEKGNSESHEPHANPRKHRNGVFWFPHPIPTLARQGKANFLWIAQL